MMAFGCRSVWGALGWKAAAVLIGVSIAGIGCGGGGSSSGSGTTVTPGDDHGNNGDLATRIFADGPNIVGSIDYAEDEDWFVFHAQEGLVYVIQVFGYQYGPTDKTDDLTGEGLWTFVPEIIHWSKVGQLASSIGNAGGTPYDVDPVHLALDGDVFAAGDSRILWRMDPTVPLRDDDYYIKITHVLPESTRGDYELHVASSQLATVFPDLIDTPEGNQIPETIQGGHIDTVQIWNDMLDDLQYEGPLSAEIGITFWQVPEFEINFEGVYQPVIFADNDDPEMPAVHLHYGYPDVSTPGDSYNFTESLDDPHPVMFDIPIEAARSDSESSGEQVAEGLLQVSDGTQIRVPITLEHETTSTNSAAKISGTIHLGDAEAHSRGGLVVDDAGLLRTLFGFPWYTDVHVSDALDNFYVVGDLYGGTLEAIWQGAPAVVSLPEAGIYGVFESELEMSSTNLRSNGEPLSEAERGTIGPDFTLHYDSALKTFQIKRQRNLVLFEFGYPTPSTEDPSFDDTSIDYAGNSIGVYPLGGSINGAPTINLGTIPFPQSPEAVGDCPPCSAVDYEPGFRNRLSQLSDSEAELLLDMYYSTGISVVIKDGDIVDGTPRAQADSHPDDSSGLEIAVERVRSNGTRAPRGVIERGYVNFASDYAAGEAITVVANGKVLGTIDSFIGGDSNPECGELEASEALAADYWPERYPYHAIAADGTSWEGHFEIRDGECSTIVLSAN